MSARIAVTRIINVSKFVITIFRVIVLVFIFCIAITIILDQIEFSRKSLDQLDPIIISSNSPRIPLTMNEEEEDIIIYDAIRYKKNSEITLKSSRLLNVENPSKSLYYDYISWPCKPDNIEYDNISLLLPYQSIICRESVYNIKYLNNNKQSLCGSQSIIKQDINKLIKLIKEEFIYEMWLDELPIFAPIGFKIMDKYYLYIHRKFNIQYNENDEIVTADIMVNPDNPDNYIELNTDIGDINDVDFTYSVSFQGVTDFERINKWKSHLLIHGFKSNKDYAAAIAIYLKNNVKVKYFLDLDEIMKEEEDENNNNKEEEEEKEEEYIDPSEMELPGNLRKKKINITTLSPEELEENSNEWKMDGIYPQLNDKELNKCGDIKRYYTSLNDEDVLRYYDKIKLWPIPQKFKLFEKNVMIERELKWSCNCGDRIKRNEILKSVIDRYDRLIFEHRINHEIEEKYIIENKYYFVAVKLVIDDEKLSELIPSENMDEWYEIIIPFDNNHCHMIYIHSKSIFGILRGIETFSQIIYYDFDLNLYMMKYVGYIMDYPYFKYRGVLLDTSRHFHPPNIIKHFIHSISFAKFNVFHWHMIDDQSWPFPIFGKYHQFDLADLYNKASYSKQERYSINDIKEIIHYANIRGIRVIPEFDTPGHVGAICKAFDVCIDIACHHSTNGVLDPSKPLTFKVVKAIYDEIVKVFNDSYLHIGNDEANYQCFRNNSNLLQWFNENNIGSMKFGGIRKRKQRDGIKINAFTVQKLFDIFGGYKDKTLISWDDLYNKVRGVLPTSVILMVWTSRWIKDVPKMLKSGYKLIITAPFYVDRWYEPLTDRYFANLWPKNTASLTNNDGKSLKENIIGGEACLWSENVDASVLDAKLWPDAAATSENLWMGPSKIKTLIPLWEYIIKDRLKWYRCFMLQRDIGFMQIDIDKKYPAEQFYLREPMYPFSCFNELDVRPIEQILPENDTREARRAARMKKAAQIKANNNNMINNMNNNMNKPNNDNNNNKNDIDNNRNIENDRNELNNLIKKKRKPLRNKNKMSMVRWVIAFLFIGLLSCVILIYCLVNVETKDKPF